MRIKCSCNILNMILYSLKVARPPSYVQIKQKSEAKYYEKILLILKNIYFGCSKEPSH